MVSQEDIAAQQELLAAYRRTLAQLLKQQALISELYTPGYRQLHICNIPIQ